MSEPQQPDASAPSTSVLGQTTRDTLGGSPTRVHAKKAHRRPNFNWIAHDPAVVPVPPSTTRCVGPSAARSIT